MASKPSVVFITLTDFTTIKGAPTGFTTVVSSQHSSMQASNPIPSSKSTSTITLPPQTSRLSVTGIPTLPSQFATPTVAPGPVGNGPNESPQSTTYANLALASIIMLAVLYLIVIGYFIYARYKGRCPKCSDLEAKVRRLEQVVEPRELREREMAEKKENNTDHRATALAKLEGRGRGNANRKTTWTSFMQSPTSTAKGKERVASGQGDSQDRFFRPISIPTVSEPAPVASHYPESRVFGESTAYPVNEVERSELDSGAHWPTYSEYYNDTCHPHGGDSAAQRQPFQAYITDDEAGRFGEDGRQAANRRRSRPYGGLTPLENFEDVDLGESTGSAEKGEQSTWKGKARRMMGMDEPK